MQTSVKTAVVVGLAGELVLVSAERDDSVDGLVAVNSALLVKRELVRAVETLVREMGIVPAPRCVVSMEGHGLEGTAHIWPTQLAVALAVAEAHGSVAIPESLGVIGSLGPDGEILPVRGVGVLLTTLAAHGVREAVVPAANMPEASLAQGIVVRVASRLGEVMAHLRGESELSIAVGSREAAMRELDIPSCDMGDVSGCVRARRGLEIAAAGGHPVVLVGPPGSGRTMLARRVPTILPGLAADAAAEVTGIHSVAGLLPTGRAMIKAPPFRAPHSSISYAGLLGGGRRPRLGEMTIAHRGVLFLDEADQLQQDMLGIVGQAAASGRLRISTHATSVEWPAEALVIGAITSCRCDAVGVMAECGCSPEARTRAQSRARQVAEALGAFLIPVTHTDHQEGGRESSAAIRERVARARERRTTRESGVAIESMPMRGEALVAAIARTIADLAGAESVDPLHMQEASEWVTGRAEGA